MIRVISTLLCLLTLVSCSNLSPISISYNKELQPVYISYSDDFNDKNIIMRVKSQLAQINISTTKSIKKANSIITISSTSQKATKNSSISTTSNASYYKNEYSTVLTIKYPKHKSKNFSHIVSVKEQRPVLENQNTFSNYYLSDVMMNDLIDQVMLIILTNGSYNA